jgi:LemA protein
MSASLFIWTLLAITIFWSVGVYNRLMRIRARGLGALGSVEKYMRRYNEWVNALEHPLGEPTQQPSAASAGHLPPDWILLLNSVKVLDAALNDMRGDLLAPPGLTKLGATFDALQQVWARLRDLPVDLAGPVIPEAMRNRWDDTSAKVQIARNGLNQILTKYNEATQQFPARLITGVLRFAPAGVL